MSCHCGTMNCGCNGVVPNAAYKREGVLSVLDRSNRFNRTAHLFKSSRKYPGVFLENGMLNFENKEAFYALITQLENEISQYQLAGIIDDDETAYNRDYPALDSFEATFGFVSLRQSIESKNNRLKEDNLANLDSGFEEDEVLTSFLNPMGELRIGDSVYVFQDKAKVLEINNASQKGLYLLRNEIRHNSVNLTNFIVHRLDNLIARGQVFFNDSGVVNTILYNRQSNIPNSLRPQQVTASSSNARATAWPCRVSDISISQSQAISRQATFTATLDDMPWAIPPNFTGPGFTNLQWEIYELNQVTGTATLIHTATTFTGQPCNGCTRTYANFTFPFPKEAYYRVCVVAWNNYCKTVQYCENFYINDLVSACCKWWDWAGTSVIYKSSRALRAELTIRNYPFFSRVRAKSTHHKVNNGQIKNIKKKAGRLRIGLYGTHYLFACTGAPHPLDRLDECTTCKRISIGKWSPFPMTIRRLVGGGMEVKSVHDVWDGGQEAHLALQLTTC